MNAIDRFYKQSGNIQRSAFIWNAMASMVLAAQSVIVMMILTRTIGIEEAGIFSFAHSNANLMYFIGEFGARRYQASDVNEKYSPSEYYGFRMLTSALMVAVLLVFSVHASITRGYTMAKTLTVFFVGMCLVVQAVSDGYEANMQQKGRLDIAAKGAFTRSSSLIVAYLIGIFVTRSLVISSALAFVLASCSFLFTVFRYSSDFGKRKPVLKPTAVKGLFLALLPIFITLFLNNYIANAPKYAIDDVLGDEIQAIYGFLFMPSYAIGVVCNFIFNPIIVSYSKLWTENKIKEFARLVGRQMLIISGLTVLALIAAFFLGIPVLSLVFGADLDGYRRELCILILGGSMWAFCTFFTTIITIMRKQNTLLVGYLIAAVAILVSAKKVVTTYGISGAAVLYTCVMMFLAVMLFVFCALGIAGRRKESL